MTPTTHDSEPRRPGATLFLSLNNNSAALGHLIVAACSRIPNSVLEFAGCLMVIASVILGIACAA